MACGGGGNRTVASEVVTGGWTQLTKFEGKEDTKTESFTVPAEAAEWKMKWNTRPGDAGFGKLKVVAFKEDGTEVGTQANVIGSSLGEMVNPGTGGFYFVVETNQPYTLTVEWKKPS
jgi:hypothetical protein